MKKIILSLLVLSTLMLTGCFKKETPILEIRMKKEIEATFDIANNKWHTGTLEINDISSSETKYLKEKYTIKNGLKDGPAESYHYNGQLRGKTFYKMGKLDGPAEFYHENGQLGIKLFYKMGELDGPAEFYDKKGKLEKKETYKMGKLKKLSEVRF